MTKRRLLLILAAGAVVALRVFACDRFLPPRTTAHVDAAAPTPLATASASASTDAGPRAGGQVAPLVAPRFDAAILLANGHVLLPAKDVVYDWDPHGPVPLRSVSLGDAGPAHTFAFAPLGGRRFVVAKADEDDNIRFELWDAEQLVAVRPLGTYAAEDPIVEFAGDGRRLMLLACAAPRGGTRACEVGVHDLANGELIHRSKIPPIAVVGPNRVGGRISPAGSYFALSGEDFPTAAYDAATGRRVFRNPDPVESDIDDEILRFAFVDDRRLLTASVRAGLRLTDLTTGRATTRPLEPSSGPGDLRVLVSPDRARAAAEITRLDGTFAVALFSFDDGSSHDVVVPKGVCPSTCAMRWSGPRELVLLPNIEGTPLELRVDAVTGKRVTEPAREPPPFDVFEAHPVLGAFDKYGTSQWHPEDRSTAYPKGALLTPKGVRIDLATIDIGALMSAVGDRFLLNGLGGLSLFTSDGARADLAAPPPPR